MKASYPYGKTCRMAPIFFFPFLLDVRASAFLLSSAFGAFAAFAALATFAAFAAFASS